MMPPILEKNVVCDKCGKETVSVTNVTPPRESMKVKMSEYPGWFTVQAVHHVTTWLLKCMSCGHSVEISR